MSRVGKLPITIPSGVDVSVEGTHIRVKGPKGELEREITPVLSVVTEEGQLRVERPDEEKRSARHRMAQIEQALAQPPTVHYQGPAAAPDHELAPRLLVDVRGGQPLRPRHGGRPHARREEARHAVARVDRQLIASQQGQILAGARIEIIAPYALFNISYVSQIYVMFRARMIDSHIEAGSESSDVRFFSESEIP